MSWEYSEDNLIEQTEIDLFFNRLGWNTALNNNNICLENEVLIFSIGVFVLIGLF